MNFKGLARYVLIGGLLLSMQPALVLGITDAPRQLNDISPEVQHAKATRIVSSILAKYHYIMQQKDSGVALNDELSVKVFDSYFKALDPNKAFFIQSDVTPYLRYKSDFDDFLLRGDLTLPFNIYTLFQQRWMQRYRFALETLEKDFDFTVDESIEIDRKDAVWAESDKQASEYWRKKVKSDLLNLLLAGKEQKEAVDVLSKRYERAIKRMEQTHSEDVFQEYMNAFAHTLDPHTSYFSPRSAENFSIDMKLSLEGIGAVLNIEDENTKIVKLVPGGPAAKTNQLSPGDKIVGVAQGSEAFVDVIGWRLDDVVDLIRGDKGSVVRLEIQGAKSGASGKIKIVSIVRDQVKLEEQAAKSKIIEQKINDKTRKIGVIDIPKFYRNFSSSSEQSSDFRSLTYDVKRLITELNEQHVEGLIIDLRNNGGGALSEASALTGLFIDKGPVVQVRGANGRVQVEYDREQGVFYDGPLLVMVNGFSASASEIFAAAIQDYGRGLVVGNQTFGKGTVQTIEDINNYAKAVSPDKPFGQVKFTTAKFYRINGGSTQNKGVIPDIEFPSFYAQSEYGESALDYAMPWDQMRKLSYREVDDLSLVTQPLTVKHNQRMKEDPEFQFIVEEIDTLKQRDDKLLSLKRSVRQALRDADDDRRLARENYRRKLKGLPEYKSLEELQAEDDKLAEESESVSEKDEEMPDPYIDEAAKILVDFVDIRTKSNLAENK